jgi:hypothetical protein
MTRDLSPAFAEALASAELCPVVFFEGEFASGTVRIWTGLRIPEYSAAYSSNIRPPIPGYPATCDALP